MHRSGGFHGFIGFHRSEYETVFFLITSDSLSAYARLDRAWTVERALCPS
jgi:hypothetical protein